MILIILDGLMKARKRIKKEKVQGEQGDETVLRVTDDPAIHDRTIHSVWDAIEDTSKEEQNMKIRSW